MTIEAQTQPVTMTERAARQIAAILGGEPAGTVLRLSVEGGGCRGFSTPTIWWSKRRPTTISSCLPTGRRC